MTGHWSGEYAPGPPPGLIVLVDVNSFFVSCERIFYPALREQPVVVLSNNDGCVISRSDEAKALGIEMGAPWFKIAAWAEARGVIARSSNYELYGSMSQRVMSVLSRFAAWQEIYSIDECFLGIAPDTPEAVLELGGVLRDSIRQGLHLPVGVGIAPTKTLAKVCNYLAKKDPSRGGVVNWQSFNQQQQLAILDSFELTDLWGIGRRTAKKLIAMGIHTALDFFNAEGSQLRQKFGVTVHRTFLELHGVPCIAFEIDKPAQQQLVFSRSFSRPITEPEQMRQVMSIYAQSVSSRLRKQGMTAGAMMAYAATSWHSTALQHEANHFTKFEYPLDEPIQLAAHATGLLKKMHPGARYAKAGIVLIDLAAKGSTQLLPLFADPLEGRAIGALIDSITAKNGSGSIGVGLGGMRKQPSWQMRREMMSKRATTHWDELAEVR